MIQANKLRIGNWVYSSMMEDYFQISELTDAHNPICEPIPLTPEILESAGGLAAISILCSTGSNFSNNVNYYPFDGDNIIGEEIKYVHELQNLYFAIHRKELTINLNATV